MAPPTFRLLNEKDYRSEEGKKDSWNRLRFAKIIHWGCPEDGIQTVGLHREPFNELPSPASQPATSRPAHGFWAESLNNLKHLFGISDSASVSGLGSEREISCPSSSLLLFPHSPSPAVSSGLAIIEQVGPGDWPWMDNWPQLVPPPAPTLYSSTYNQWHIFKLYRYFWPTVLPHSYFNKYWLSTKAFQTLC